MSEEMINQATVEQVQIIDEYTNALAHYYLATEGVDAVEHFRIHNILVSRAWTKFNNKLGEWSYSSNPTYALIVIPKIQEQLEILFKKIPDEILETCTIYDNWCEWKLRHG